MRDFVLGVHDLVVRVHTVLLGGAYSIVYMTISIIGAWQVFANVGITFERIDIFS